MGVGPKAKLLIDECLSPTLAHIARERGFHEATHIRWIGKAGWKDWDLKHVLLDNDWVLVTRNSGDFRGPRDSPGSKGHYADVELHPGLICLNGPVDMKLPFQMVLFHKALDQLDVKSDLINQVLEISCSEIGGQVDVLRYDLPKIG